MSDLSDDAIYAYAANIFDLEDARDAVQGDLKEAWAHIRDAHGKRFADSLKLAVKRARMDQDKRQQADEIDAEAERILGVLNAGPRVRVARGAREALPAHDADGVIIEPEAPTPLPEAPVNPVAHVENAGGAKTSEQEPSEPEGSGEVQDGLPVHLPTNSTPDSPIGEEAGEANPSETLSASPAINSELEASGAAAGESPVTLGLTANAGGNDVADRPVHVPEEPGRGAASVNAPAEGGTNSAQINSEPEPAFPPAVSVPGDRGQPAPPPSELAPVVTPDRTKHNPWCQDPDECGIEASWDYFCEACKKRKANALTAAAHQEASEGRTLQ